MQQFLRYRPSLAVLATALLALAACNQNSGSSQTANGATPPALPLTTGEATAPILAPSASALPAAPRPKIVRVASEADQYAYVDQAQAMAGALGSAPPDYAFDYDGARPWVWQTSDNSTRFVEPVEGGYRYYYYRPGSDYPYYVQDPQYGYGFDDGQLVTVYDARGAILPPQYVDERADYAGRYLARARALYDASRRAQRQSVIAANWAARRAQIDEQQAEWARERAQDAAWQSYHQQHDAELQNYWQTEHDRRYASAQAFDQWHDQGYQGPPPPPAYGPAAVAGAAVAGGVIGALIAGHHDHGSAPPAAQGTAPNGPNAAPGFAGGRPVGPNPADQRAAELAQRQQGQDAQRAAVDQQQAAAAATARQQALAQGDQHRAAEAAGRQAQAQQEAAAAHQAQAQAAAQAQQVRQQQAAQAGAQRQALAASQTQAHQQAQAQAAAQRQAAAAAQAQARQQQAAQAAGQRQAAQAAASQAAAQRQAADAARVQQQGAQRQAAEAARGQAMQAAAQHQAQAQAAQAAVQHQAQAQAAAVHAQAAQAAARAAHPPGVPHPGEPPRPGEPGHPQP